MTDQGPPVAQRQWICRYLGGDRHPLTESLVCPCDARRGPGTTRRWVVCLHPARMVQACLVVQEEGDRLDGKRGEREIVEKARVSHWFSSCSDAHDPLTHSFLIIGFPASLGNPNSTVSLLPTAHILSFEALCPLLLVLSAAPGRALTISFTSSPAVDIHRQPALYKASSVRHCS